MSGLSRMASILAAAFCVVLSVVPRIALAQGGRSQSLHVLAIDSDDADEQADALTNALRSQVRTRSGWTLLDTTQSLSMLTAAFQCPQHPDSACLVRIGDKLKTDQFLWGVMTKAPGHQLTVEVHVWARGKPDKSTRETFSDNMKDANDDNLRKVAAQIFGKLLVTEAGSLVIHASGGSGSVLVDGVAKGALDNGRATLTLPAGPHTIELRAPGFAPAKRDVTIEPLGTAQLEIVLEPEAAAAAPSQPLPIRPILGWTAVGVGVVLGAVATGFGVGYLSDHSDNNTQAEHNYLTGSPVKVADPCNVQASFQGIPNIERGCADEQAQKSDIVNEIVLFSVGGVVLATGIYLLATDSKPASQPPATTGSLLKNLQFSPSVGPGGGSMVVLGQF